PRTIAPTPPIAQRRAGPRAQVTTPRGWMPRAGVSPIMPAVVPAVVRTGNPPRRRPWRRADGGALVAGDVDHLFAGHHLDAGPAVRLAQGDLVRVEAVPAVEVGPAHAARGEQRRNRLLRRVLRLPPGALVVDQVADGLHGVGLGVSDQPDRAALDPAGRVHARHALVRALREDLALAVRDDAVPLVEGDPRQRRAEVADGPVDRLHGELADLAGADDAARAVRPGALPAERGDTALLVGDDLVGPRVEVQVQTAGCLARRVVGGRALAPRLQHAVDHHHLLVRGDGVERGLVVVEVLVVDHHVDIAHLAELAQLEGRELHV